MKFECPMSQKSNLILLLVCLLFLTACELLEPPPPVVESPLPTPTLPPLALAVDVEDDAIVVPIPIDPPSFNAYLNDAGNKPRPWWGLVFRCSQLSS